MSTISENARPVCLFAENSNRLVTLWEMLRVFADTFIKLLDDLRQAEIGITELVRSRGSLKEAHKWGEVIGNSINELERDCSTLDLRSALKQVRYIHAQMRTEDDVSMPPLVAEVRKRVMEDLEDRVFLCLEPSRTDQFYAREQHGQLKGNLVRRAPESVWGDEVCSNFQSAISDIKHGTSCLIFDEGTACVFHLMRVMERGLRALGKSLNDTRLDPKVNPSWGTILKRCDDELKLPEAKRSPEWKSDDSFFVDATANLRAVKDAWRNPTMHVEKTYEYEEALHIWNTVRSFMRHLATRLQE